MKKIFIYTLISAFILTSITLPALAESDLSEAEIEEDSIKNIQPTDTLNFILDARWGFVQGNPDQKTEEKSYNGSIYAGNTNIAKISLNSKLLFEQGDEVILKSNPVSWNSKIYSHWDGIRVNVRAKADAFIVVKTGQGDITKTAKEWFELSQPEILNTGDNEMLVVKTHRNNHRKNGIIVWWGVKEPANTACDDTPSIELDSNEICYVPENKVDFSGSLTMDTNSLVKLKKALRFERADKINEHNRSLIEWTSQINNGRDGIYSLMLPNQDASVASGFTISFDNISGPSGGTWSKHYSFEDAINGIRDTVHIGGVDYIVAVSQKNIVRQLIKDKETKKLYLVNNNVKQEVSDLDILHANGFSGDEAVVMDSDEIEIFADGENLEYPDGTVIDDDNNSYVLVNGIKRKVLQGKITNVIKRREHNIKIGDKRLENIATGDEINLDEEITDNTLVTVPGDTAVWRIRGDKRQVFTNARIFDLHRLDWSSVKKITQEELQKYQWAPPVEFPDGSLVKIPTDPKVYILENGIRRWIESEGDLKGLGYKFNQIIDMNPTDISNYPVSDPVIADEVENIIKF